MCSRPASRQLCAASPSATRMQPVRHAIGHTVIATNGFITSVATPLTPTSAAICTAQHTVPSMNRMQVGVHLATTAPARSPSVSHQPCGCDGGVMCQHHLHHQRSSVAPARRANASGTHAVPRTRIDMSTSSKQRARKLISWQARSCSKPKATLRWSLQTRTGNFRPSQLSQDQFQHKGT